MKFPLAPFVLLAALFACDSGDDGSDDDVADTSESGGSDTTDATDSSDDATSEGGPEDFPAVECGDLLCAEGSICVMPPETCDYNQDPPMWVQDPSECLAVPPSCYGLVDVELNECLKGALCMGGEEFSSATFMNGTLDCPPNGADCF